MVNEWEEFCEYTGTPVYASNGKTDRRYLGRFTFEMFLDAQGLGRVLTVLARGYLFHDRTGALLEGEPGERIETAWRALCAWCSVPQAQTRQAEEAWKPKSDFSELHTEFPELVDERGCGWYARHVHAVVEYTLAHSDVLMDSAVKSAKKLQKDFDAQWRKRIVQCQIPPFAPSTRQQWLMSFTEAISNALELGPLRQSRVELPRSLLDRLEQLRPPKISKKLNVIPTLVAYYIANRQPDSDWVVLPVINLEAYFGTSSFSRKYLGMIPPEIMERSQQNSGVSRYRVLSEYLPQGEPS